VERKTTLNATGFSMVRTPSYDALGRLDELHYTDNATSSEIAGFERIYDVAHRPLFERWTHRQSGNQDLGRLYEHDPSGRLTDVTEGPLGGSPANPTISDPSVKWSYNLDGLGNWAEHAKDGQIARNVADPMNFYEAVGQEDQGDGTWSPGRSQEKDVLGSLHREERDGFTIIYDHDAYGRLVAIWKEDPTGNPTLEQVAAFAYDALNRRIEEDILGLGGGSVGRDRRTWVYDGWRIVSEIGYSSSTLQDDPASPGDLVRARNVYGAGRDEILFAERDLDSMGLDTQLIPVTDFLGSTERVLDTAGGVEERYEYSPYGLQMVFQSGTMQPATQVDYRVGYTGHRTELLIAASRQLTYARNRVYDPENGRFLQQDPLGFTDGPNVYQYATSAPVRNTDPYGLSASFGGMSSINSCPGEVKPKKTFGGGGGIRSGPPPASPPMPRMGGGHGIAVFMPRAENKRDAEFFKTKKQAEETQESNKSWRQRSGEALMTLAKNDPQAAMLLQKKYNLDASIGRTASVTVSDPTYFTLGSMSQGGTLDSTTAFEHYRSGDGTPLRMSFDDIDTSRVRPSQFPQVRTQLGRAPRDAALSIDDRLVFATSGDQALFLGDITLRLQGQLATRNGGTFEFSGTLKSFDDFYDFNKANRGFIGEFLTWIGRGTPGTPYWIEIRGAKPISESGRLP